MTRIRNTHRVPECGLRNEPTLTLVIVLALSLLAAPLSSRILTALRVQGSAARPDLGIEWRFVQGKLDRSLG